MSEWISCKDRLPDKRGRYLVLEDDKWLQNMDDKDIDKTKWIRIVFYDGDFPITVSHWIPLPEPPEEKE